MMAEYLSGELTSAKFSAEFSLLYGFSTEFDYAVLTKAEYFWFNKLFTLSSRYSSNPEDFILYPKVYFSDTDIDSAIRSVYEELTSNQTSQD